jgi:hypothetical protein
MMMKGHDRRRGALGNRISIIPYDDEAAAATTRRELPFAHSSQLLTHGKLPHAAGHKTQRDGL